MYFADKDDVTGVFGDSLKGTFPASRVRANGNLVDYGFFRLQLVFDGLFKGEYVPGRLPVAIVE